MPDWFEWVFVTPSHHRVHHASNPIYIDRNFGGLFIVWDRLFGTYAHETDECVYGLTIPLRSWDPVYASFCHFHSVYVRFRKFPKEPLINKLKVLFYGPGFSPKTNTYLPVPYVDAETFVKYNPFLPGLLKLYLGVQFFGVYSTGILYIASESSFQLDQAWIPIAFLLFWLICVGKLMEFCGSGPMVARRSFHLETIRLTTTIVLSSALLVLATTQLLGGAKNEQFLNSILPPLLASLCVSPRILATTLIFHLCSLISLKLFLEPLIDQQQRCEQSCDGASTNKGLVRKGGGGGGGESVENLDRHVISTGVCGGGDEKKTN